MFNPLFSPGVWPTHGVIIGTVVLWAQSVRYTRMHDKNTQILDFERVQTLNSTLLGMAERI